jgi:hypothetical protein
LDHAYLRASDRSGAQEERARVELEVKRMEEAERQHQHILQRREKKRAKRIEARRLQLLAS